MRTRVRELEELRTGDGRAIPERMKAEIRRELDRLHCCAGRSLTWKPNAMRCCTPRKRQPASPGAQLLKLRGIGPEFAYGALARGSLPPLRQPAAVGGLRRAGAKSLAKRRHEKGTGDLEVRQCAPAYHDDRGRLVMASTSAGIGAEPVVSRARQDRPRSSPTRLDRRTGPQASCCALALHDTRRNSCRGIPEGCLNSRISVPRGSASLSDPAG